MCGKSAYTTKFYGIRLPFVPPNSMVYACHLYDIFLPIYWGSLSYRRFMCFRLTSVCTLLCSFALICDFLPGVSELFVGPYLLGLYAVTSPLMWLGRSGKGGGSGQCTGVHRASPLLSFSAAIKSRFVSNNYRLEGMLATILANHGVPNTCTRLLEENHVGHCSSTPCLNM